MEARAGTRAGDAILDFETLFSDFHELLHGSGLNGSPKLGDLVGPQSTQRHGWEANPIPVPVPSIPTGKPIAGCYLESEIEYLLKGV